MKASPGAPSALSCEQLNQPSGAVFDDRRRYRYLLWRSFDRALPAVTFVMLNPSCADEEFNDPTIARVISLSRSWGFGRVFVVNLFAYMTAEPALLKRRRRPVGERNDEWIDFAAAQSEVIVLAWGNHGKHLERACDVVKRLNQPQCRVLAVTAQNQPKHPLYARKDTSLLRAPADWWV